MAVGENRNFVSALIVPNFVNLKEWCAKNGVQSGSAEDMAKNPEIQKLFKNAIDEKNKGFGQWETIKKFELMPKEWTVDGGELTPTTKIKRKVVLEKYKDVIEHIYSN